MPGHPIEWERSRSPQVQLGGTASTAASVLCARSLASKYKQTQAKRLRRHSRVRASTPTYNIRTCHKKQAYALQNTECHVHLNIHPSIHPCIIHASIRQSMHACMHACRYPYTGSCVARCCIHARMITHEPPRHQHLSMFNRQVQSTLSICTYVCVFTSRLKLLSSLALTSQKHACEISCLLAQLCVL